MSGENSLKLRVLEPRIMFDGAGVATMIDVGANSLDKSSYSNNFPDPPVNRVNQSYRELAFVDSKIKNSDVLIKGINPDIKAVVLNAESDGIQQIADYLENKSGIDSIHILSHGRDAEITIAKASLSAKTIDNYEPFLSSIGQAMSEHGDILFYGCDVTKSDDGLNLIESIAKMTGADVAASTDKTGNASLGGNWNLESATGKIDSNISFSREHSQFSGLLGTPAVSNGGSTGYIKDAAAVVVSSSITVENGSAYGGGRLQVAITSADSSETLNLTKVDSAVTTNGIVSAVGSLVYLGNGSSADQIGVIDSTNDGSSGKTLQIDFISNAFTNPSFETNDFTGWTTDTSTQIDLGTTSIAGITTPNDSTDPANSGGDSDVPSTKGTWTATIKSDDKTAGTYSLQLKSVGMTTLNGYDVVHGPSVYSDEFEAENGQVIKFDWRALGGSDAYDVFGYIVNTGTNATTEILNATGSSAAGTTSWATANVTIPADGDYRFVFVAGTYDFTGGKAAGASLYIDNIQVYGNLVTDAVVQDISRLVTYKTTNTTLSVTDRESRTVTFTATDSDNNSGNNTAKIYETTETEEIYVTQPAKSTSISIHEYTPPKPNSSGEMVTILTSQNDVRTKQGFSNTSEANTQPSPTTIDNTQPQTSGTLTKAGDGRFQVMVVNSESGTSNILLNKGMADKAFKSGSIKFQVPIDTFAHSDPKADVRLEAKSADGQSLPTWLNFDAQSGTFSGEAPPGMEGAIDILVTATDAEGRDVTTKFTLFIGGTGAPNPSQSISPDVESVPFTEDLKNENNEPEENLEKLDSKENPETNESGSLKGLKDYAQSGKVAFSRQLGDANRDTKTLL